VSPKRHRDGASGESLAPDSLDSRRNRPTEVPANRLFPKFFLTGDSVRFERLGAAPETRFAHCSTVCCGRFVQMRMSQNPLWNRGFMHFEKYRAMARACCGAKRARLRDVDRARTTASV
jgi:hypothetical protein